MKTRDQRTALMNEILQGIRMLKSVSPGHQVQSSPYSIGSWPGNDLLKGVFSQSEKTNSLGKQEITKLR